VKFIVHDEPALRADSNYISRVDLAPFGFPDLVEQVWLRQEDTGVFVICCIPFRVYGLALRDRVRTTSDGSLVSEVVERSGRRVLRVLFVAGWGSELPAGAERIESLVRELGLLYEWSGDRHIAIDVPAGADVEGLIGAIRQEERSAGAEWEWADVEPFSR